MKTAALISLILNFIIIGGTIANLIHDMKWKDKDGVAHPFKTYRYFTTLSNVYAMAGAILALAFTAAKREMPLWAMTITYSSAVSVAVTFVTVMAFLGPVGGYRNLITKSGFHVHVLTPVLANLNICAFEKTPELPAWFLLFGVLPVIVYSILYLYMVLIRTEEKGGWEDFYGFNMGGKWRLSMILMYAGGTILSILMLVLHNL